MKIIKTVILDGKEVDLQSEHIILELNNTGRGFITVKTDQPCVGKPKWSQSEVSPFSFYP